MMKIYPATKNPENKTPNKWFKNKILLSNYANQISALQTFFEKIKKIHFHMPQLSRSPKPPNQTFARLFYNKTFTGRENRERARDKKS